jgi:hypothetical protein
MTLSLAIGTGVFVAVVFFRMFFRNLEDFGENLVHFLIGAWLWSDPLSTTRQDNLFSGLKTLVYLLIAVGSGCFVYYFLG